LIEERKNPRTVTKYSNLPNCLKKTYGLSTGQLPSQVNRTKLKKNSLRLSRWSPVGTDFLNEEKTNP